MWGLRGRALSHPRPSVLSGVRPEPTTHSLWVPGVRACGPVTNPTARAFASWLCALGGWHEDARGGRLFPGCGASGVGRSPTPDHSSFQACGRGATTHWLWVRGVRAWGPVTNPTAGALVGSLCALWGRHEGTFGGRLLPRRPGSGALPNPDHLNFRVCGRGPLPTGCGCGDAGVGTCYKPHRARSCVLVYRAVGAA